MCFSRTRQGEPRVAEILRSARWRWWGLRGNFSTGELLFSSKFRHPLRRSRSWWHLVVQVFLPNIHFIVFSMCFVFFAFCSGHFPTKCIAFNPTQGNSDYKFVQFNSVRHTKMLYNKKRPRVSSCWAFFGRPFFSPQNGWWTRFRPIATMKLSSRDQDSTWAGGIVDQFDFQGDSDIKKSSP